MPPKLRRRSTGAALSHAASGEEAPKSSETSPAPAAAAAGSGRWTRSRSARSHLGLDSDSTDHPRVVSGSSDQPPKKRKKTTTAVAAAAGSTRLASRPVPGRYPDYPSLRPGQHALSKKHMSAVQEWMEECSRISKLEKQARPEDIPTLRDNPRDPLTPDAVVSSQDKAMVLRVARSVVSVSSSKPDGELISQCTGIVIGWDGANKCAKILTSCSTLSVRMPNRTITEGRLLFFNVHYGIALLEVKGDFQLQVPSFGLGINYGQDVFALARDENMSLMGGSGGPVVDHDGNIIGIAFDRNPGPVVISITTIRTCIEMWHQFSRVARPMLGMQLKAVELLDVSMREELCLEYNITGGFIVNLLEDYLLSLGWGYLQGLSFTVDLKVEVHNLADSYKESITFPVPFSDASKRMTQSAFDLDIARTFIFWDVWLIAQRLMGLDDEDKMWSLIEEVWVEMLFFSAGRCRGYLHAKSLGSGVDIVAPVGTCRNGGIP
ncbi:hypothetical protein OsJ_26037 [Oryza sativa Japonica Group]|uniref:Uncharacterized protein n=1 Tax=Oryza sativa subsp. japonica TaxID=39947 RepID=B9FZ24_ORYSJ|nr:hypothetical protein OsJ_26037 [Oryza sativa Japonica Group]